MGVKERRERERVEVRTAILDAARELILEQGVAAVSMRKIAERIEYSPTAIYQHFPDKESLLRAMCERDFDALADELRQRTANVTDPVERILISGEAYIRFAMAYPSHFRVMFMTPQAHPAVLNEEDRCRQGDPDADGYAALRQSVQDAMEAGRFRAELADADLVAQTMWAAAHGVASIQLVKSDDPWLKLAPLEARTRLALDSILRGTLRDPSEVDRIVERRGNGQAEGQR
jgi:AcrR family transcriptional regulator